MPAAGFFRYYYLAWFSQPRSERTLYKLLRQAKPLSIVELGVGSVQRARRLLEVAQRFRPQETIRYSGIDQFEARPKEQPPLSLKRAHQTLSDSGAKIRLVPGDPYFALARVANALTQTDLLVVSSYQDRAALARAWFYVPRMLHEGSLVLLEEPGAAGQTAYRRLTHEQVAELAKTADTRRLRVAA